MDGVRRRPAAQAPLPLLALPALVLAGLALVRAVRLPLWRDEAATALFSSLDLASLADATSHVDRVVVVYYALVGLLPADGELGLRLLSVVAGAAAVLVLTVLAARWWGRWPALAAGAVLALNPLTVQMAATARPYALATLGLATALLLADRALESGRRRDWAAYSVALALTGLMHLFGVLGVAGVAFLALRRGRGAVLRWLGWSVLAAVPVAVLAAAAASQSSQISWLERPGLVRGVGTLVNLASYRSGGEIDPAMLLALLGAGVAVVVGLVGAVRSPERTELARWLAAAGVVLVPWAVLLVMSLVASPVLRSSYLAPSVVGLALLVASGVALGTSHRLRLLAAAAVAVHLLANVPALAADLRTGWVQDDFPGAAAELERLATEGDHLVVMQRYYENGTAGGVADHLDDEDYEADLRRRVVTGDQPVVDVRTVASVDPWATVPATGGEVSSGTVLLVDSGATLSDDDRAELAAAGLVCDFTGEPLTSEQHGAVRVDSWSCEPDSVPEG